MASWYRVRKNWNNGKWDSSQIGAYSSESEAINDCTQDRLIQGYRVFDPNGNIVYPNQLALQMMTDKVISAAELPFWNSVLNGDLFVSANEVASVIKKYSDYYQESKSSKRDKVTQYVSKTGLTILEIPTSKFKIKYIDSSIRDYRVNHEMNKDYTNLGYFAKYGESGVNFTLPVANLVADIDLVEFKDSVALPYIKERPIRNGKVYWSCTVNAESQFREKEVSTLIISEDGTVDIQKVSSVDFDSIKYAVSGAPVLTDGKIDKSYKSEGWDNSIVRPTYHGFLGIKKSEPKYVYYFKLKTGSSNLFTGEVYDMIKDLGFDKVIKVDGGGSFYFQYGGLPQVGSLTTRQINNISIIG